MTTFNTVTPIRTQPAGDPSQPALRIAFIQASWHKDIVNRSRNSFAEEMAKLVNAEIDFFEVPGAYEIPLQAKLLAKTGNYASVVAAGLVVDGGIYRHEFVAQAVINGLMQVQLETEVPVFTAVLTPHHFHEIAEHEEFFSDHFVKKGAEAARACAQIVK